MLLLLLLLFLLLYLFAVSIDVALVTTFIWPGLVELPLTVGLWTAGAVLWLVSAVSAAAAFPPPIAVARSAEADDLFVKARDAYLGVISEISRVNALRQALESSQTALKATEAGYEVGTRTAVDVLESRRNLVQAQTNYSRSRYDYILNVLRLRLAEGTLDAALLEEVNGWLSEAPAPRQ